MTKIHSAQFKQGATGIKNDTATQERLNKLGVDGKKILDAADANRDGKIEGSDELGKLWRQIDDFDVDGSRATMDGRKPLAMLAAVKPPMASSTGAPDLYGDDGTMRKGAKGPEVKAAQEDLIKAGYALPRHGADGHFGDETTSAVKRFQTANGLAPTGELDANTAAKLKAAPAAPPAPTQTAPRQTAPTQTAPTQTAPRPTQTAPTQTAPTQTAPTQTAPRTESARPTAPTVPTPRPAPTPTAATPTPTAPPLGAAPTVGVTLPPGVRPGSTQAMVDAARVLATGERAANYGTVNAWRNIDPNHAARVDVRMGGLVDRWKCNLFGGNAMAAAGFEPPYYGNRRTGEYPVAEQWHLWATPSAEHRTRARAAGETVVDHARTARNPSRFDLMDEVRPTEIGDPAARRQRIEELLSRVQPGDVVTVDHPGAAGSDGGHVRVCVGKDENGRPLFAQAQQDTARVKAEGFSDANWETRDAIYILRPNTPRR